MIEDLKSLYQRDLDRLSKELEAYPNEESLWIKVDGINNTAGNLFMHLCGNLQHFIGAILNKSEYVRDRDFEFNGKLSFDEIGKEIETTKSAVTAYFEKAEYSSFNQPYPIEVFGYTMTINSFIIHLQGHLNYHLGQINYHRRILSKV